MYRIVIADDEQVIRKGLQCLLWEKHGMKIIAVAADGIEAQEIIDSQEFDILLTDIKMPGMNGIELAKNLYLANKFAKTILLSGYGEFSYAQQAINVGVFEYILKPSTPNEIMDCVTRACEKIEEEHRQTCEVQKLKDKVEDYQQLIGADTVMDEEKKDTDIKEILKYIYANYNQELTLSVLAEHFHFSAVYLSFFIKRFTGHTFLEILTSVRMFHAAKYLRETKLKNAEIGARIGIPDERYFGQVFKKRYGMPPYEFRKSKEEVKFFLEDFLLADEGDTYEMAFIKK